MIEKCDVLSGKSNAASESIREGQAELRLKCHPPSLAALPILPIVGPEAKMYSICMQLVCCKIDCTQQGASGCCFFTSPAIWSSAFGNWFYLIILDICKQL